MCSLNNSQHTCETQFSTNNLRYVYISELQNEKEEAINVYNTRTTFSITISATALHLNSFEITIKFIRQLNTFWFSDFNAEAIHCLCTYNTHKCKYI